MGLAVVIRAKITWRLRVTTVEVSIMIMVITLNVIIMKPSLEY